jgi:hypothetical protein
MTTEAGTGAKGLAVVVAACAVCCAAPVAAAVGIAVAPIGLAVAGVAAAGAGVLAVRDRRRRQREADPASPSSWTGRSSTSLRRASSTSGRARLHRSVAAQ